MVKARCPYSRGMVMTYDPKELSHLNISDLFEEYCRLKFRNTLAVIQNKCKQDGIEFDLELDDLAPFPIHCPVLNTPIDYFKKGKGASNDSPSLDRLDPNKGYVKGNVRVISQRANRLKQDSNVLEAIRVLAYQLDVPYGEIRERLALYI